MQQKIKKAFEDIKADEQLKDDVFDYIVQQKAKRHRFSPKYTIVLACCLLFFIFAGGSYYVYFTPTSYIDVDINPSIGLSLNRFGKVIKTTAYNTDGERILETVDLKLKSYEEALDILVVAFQQNGYVTDDALLSVTVAAKQDEQILMKRAQTTIDKSLNNCSNTLKKEVFLVDMDTKNYAHNLALSPARYLAIEQLREVDSEIVVEQCRNHSISELKEMTRKGKGKHEKPEKPKNSKGHHHQ